MILSWLVKTIPISANQPAIQYSQWFCYKFPNKNASNKFLDTVDTISLATMILLKSNANEINPKSHAIYHIVYTHILRNNGGNIMRCTTMKWPRHDFCFALTKCLNGKMSGETENRCQHFATRNPSAWFRFPISDV